MKGIKWLYFDNAHIAREELYEGIIASPISRNGVAGFELIEVRPNYIFATYIEKKEQNIFFQTIEGETGSQLVVSYQRTNFKIDFSLSLMEFYDPPRSTNHIIERLASISGFKLFVEPIKIDLYSLIDILSELSDTGNLDVIQLECNRVVLNVNTVASFVVNGVKSVRQDFDMLLNGRFHDLNRVKLSMDGLLFEISSNGSVRTNRSGGIPKALHGSLSHCIGLLQK